MRTHDVNEIKAEFQERVTRIIWCNGATVDGQGRPRSRVLHPVWEDLTAWLTTTKESFKSRHLARVPYLSLAYIDPAKPVYADCRTEWIDDPAEKQRVWDLIRATPEPVGFDPGDMYDPIYDPSKGLLPFGLLKLTPYRIVLTQWPEPQQMWTPAATDRDDHSLPS